MLLTWTAAAIRKTNGRSSSGQVVYSPVCGLRNPRHLTRHGGRQARKSPSTCGERQVGFSLMCTSLQLPSFFLFSFFYVFVQLLRCYFVIHTCQLIDFHFLFHLQFTQSQFGNLASSLKRVGVFTALIPSE